MQWACVILPRMLRPHTCSAEPCTVGPGTPHWPPHWCVRVLWAVSH
ncbi:hypothetical protein Cadr_000026000 [Camelus dromedarius]|uniref:Uncharacterized protein n=1 Tax=Camelus dromedarius TaxID=9838 RepID=A0A5N4CEU1_CAMDR|nr:hypothetical protein Cadr_000026000 [Camelus dromedarius]